MATGGDSGVTDLPTISETVPNVIAVGWQAVVAPNGTAKPIIAKVNDTLNAMAMIDGDREDIMVAADRGVRVAQHFAKFGVAEQATDFVLHALVKLREKA